MRTLAPRAVCDELVDTRATALLLLVGYPEPAVSIVKSKSSIEIRRNPIASGSFTPAERARFSYIAKQHVCLVEGDPQWNSRPS
jgi:hypothetical protein